MDAWPKSLDAFSKIWVVDFEFNHPEGGLPEPRCMVAREWRTKTTIRLWLEGGAVCPFSNEDLLVAYYASAEMGCFLALGWEVRPYVLDLFVEFKNHLGGRYPLFGLGLLGACRHFGIDCISTESKDENRLLAQQEQFTEAERNRLVDYCQTDVEATERLLGAMLPLVDIPRAFLRGRYMAAAASIENVGIPMDAVTLKEIRDRWPLCRLALIDAVDAEFNVFEGGSFKESLWRYYCSKNGMSWPQLPTGGLDFKDETFRQMCALYPQIQPMRELRATLDQMKLNALAVGPDARNRYMLSAFRALTGRNQPSNQKAVFGPATWIRHLIKPAKGMAIAYLDYEQQEHGIAAALSDDANMKKAYESGDPYLAFAKQAGAVPPNATKKSHPSERDLYKATALAVQYGMGAESLAARIGKPREYGKALLANHKAVYPDYWRWSDAAASRGMLGLPLTTIFGWRTLGKGDGNPRTFRNFPAQANGAEMLRLAIIALVESGIRVCAPVHDAVLIEAPSARIDDVVEVAQAIMEEASRAVLSGFTIRTDAKIVKYPHRYVEPRGVQMWDKLTQILKQQLVGDSPQ